MRSTAAATTVGTTNCTPRKQPLNRPGSLDRADELLRQAEAALTHTGALPPGQQPLLGVDLGTASIVLVALDAELHPVACELETASVVRDGLVVDYLGAAAIVRRLRERMEQRLGAELLHAAIAVPPGTSPADAGTHRHVTEACGLEVSAIVDEPTAANEVLGIRDGVVVDIGGGTTGLTIFRQGKAVYTADEPTGGAHVSLVLMGAGKIPFEEAEALKRDPARAAQVLGQVKPVIEKMAAIVQQHIRGHRVEDVVLVGGTCCLPGVEQIFTRVLGIPARKPTNPMLVTPLGIAMCAAKEKG